MNKTLKASVVFLRSPILFCIYVVKLVSRHQGSDFVSVVAICAATSDFPFWGTRPAV